MSAITSAGAESVGTGSAGAGSSKLVRPTLRHRLAERGIDRTLLLLVPAVVVIGGLFCYPFIYGLGLSLQPLKGGGGMFADYRRFWSDPFFRDTTWITLKLGLPAALINVAASVPVAYKLRRPFRGKRTLTAILVVPITLGTVLTALPASTLGGVLTQLPAGNLSSVLTALPTGDLSGVLGALPTGDLSSVLTTLPSPTVGSLMNSMPSSAAITGSSPNTRAFCAPATQNRARPAASKISTGLCRRLMRGYQKKISTPASSDTAR